MKVESDLYMRIFHMWMHSDLVEEYLLQNIKVGMIQQQKCPSANIQIAYPLKEQVCV